MTATWKTRAARGGCVAAIFLLTRAAYCADDPPITREQFQLLLQQNQQMQQQLKKQQELIDSLTGKVSQIQDANARRDQEAGETVAPAAGFHVGRVDISGEGGIAYFESQAKGQTPNNEFRVDEARLFLEAPVWENVYFFSELTLATHEQKDLNMRFDRLYLDFENVSQLWGQDRILNLRVGRFDIPFGEEYQERFAIDNPLISHSVSDLWGRDDGLELYGAVGRVQYVVAVQNGGDSPPRDFDGDKSVTARIGCDPVNWLHLSVSGMRTGNLNTQGDGLSALWFGGGWVRSLEFGNATRFHAELAEADAQVRLPFAQVKGAGGYLHYGDNAPGGGTDRDVYYYYVEGTHDFTHQFYGAARFSQIFAHNGFPITGNGMMSDYFFSPTLTTDYWRLSLGLGYRFSPNLLVKGEYSFNRGHESDGEIRDHEDVVSLEAAFKF